MAVSLHDQWPWSEALNIVLKWNNCTSKWSSQPCVECKSVSYSPWLQIPCPFPPAPSLFLHVIVMRTVMRWWQDSPKEPYLKILSSYLTLERSLSSSLRCVTKKLLWLFFCEWCNVIAKNNSTSDLDVFGSLLCNAGNAWMVHFDLLSDNFMYEVD